MRFPGKVGNEQNVERFRKPYASERVTVRRRDKGGEPFDEGFKAALVFCKGSGQIGRSAKKLDHLGPVRDCFLKTERATRNAENVTDSFGKKFRRAFSFERVLRCFPTMQRGLSGFP